MPGSGISSTIFERFQATTRQLKSGGTALSQENLKKELKDYSDAEAQALLINVFGAPATETGCNKEDLAIKLCQLGEGSETEFSTAEAEKAVDLASAAVKAHPTNSYNQYKPTTNYDNRSYLTNDYRPWQPGATLGAPPFFRTNHYEELNKDYRDIGKEPTRDEKPQGLRTSTKEPLALQAGATVGNPFCGGTGPDGQVPFGVSSPPPAMSLPPLPPPPLPPKKKH